MMFRKSSDPTESIKVDYTNHRGLREVRTITPLFIEWVKPGHNQYHPEGGFMLACFCHRARERRAFAVKDIHAWDIKE